MSVLQSLPGSIATASAFRIPEVPNLIGQSAVMVQLREEIARVARTEAKVLITGESGVGKEVVAKNIHVKGPRASRPFVALNCAGISETLLESELFGHVKGSFTGAYRDKMGALESAHRGTIFLDEIGEMSLRMQGLLLRFLETGEIQRVGAEGAARYVDVRVICATHRDLRAMVGTGAFREDLYYRLNVVHIRVPALRERREDIPEFVTHLLNRFVATHRSPIAGISPDALVALRQHSWPGNVRELQNTVERLVVGVLRSSVEVDDLPAEVRAPNAPRRPMVERRRTVVDDMYEALTVGGQSFWDVVYARYMAHEITRDHVRGLVRRGLKETRGNYRAMIRLFNVDAHQYKRFMSFLSKHQCHVAFQEFRMNIGERETA